MDLTSLFLPDYVSRAILAVLVDEARIYNTVDYEHFKLVEDLCYAD
jgi:hypothetical protein